MIFQCLKMKKTIVRVFDILIELFITNLATQMKAKNNSAKIWNKIGSFCFQLKQITEKTFSGIFNYEIS